MKNVLLFLWQLPQNLIGLFLRLFLDGKDQEYNDAIVRKATSMRGGISLGKYIIVSYTASDKTIMHEYGHCRQSQMLGWLYLPIIGIPSIIWAGLYRWVIKPTPDGYYKFYTEKWADKIAGIRRG